jgi:hypothetical protein
VESNGVETARLRNGTRVQAYFRKLNDWIASRRPSGMFIEFACECADRDCRAPMVLTVDEYESVRRSPARFAVLPGHDDPALCRLVEQNERYAVVEQR